LNIQPILLGQAPSAQGDGRPFTGPSGKTVCKWLGVEGREQLAEYFYLENLLPHPLPRNSDERRKSSQLTPAQARLGAKNFLTRTRFRLRKDLGSEGYTKFIDQSRFLLVVVLGTKVWRGFNLPSHDEWFTERLISDEFMMVKFPHPSGLNHELNDPDFVRETARHLRSIALHRQQTIK